MATNKIRVNLAADTFPLLLDDQGRSLIIQNRAESQDMQTSGNSQRNQSSIPIPIYVSNYIPTAIGYSSMYFNKDAVPKRLTNPLNKEATIFEVFSVDGIKSHIIGNSDAIYVRDGNNKVWKRLLPNDRKISPRDIVTTATVQGVTYICIRRIGVFTYDPVDLKLISVELDGLISQELLGITAVGSYLIAYNSNTIYWSSVLDPLDFVPSLTTGAGSTQVSSVRSDIVSCLSTKNGMIIYTTSGAVSAQLTGDMNNPLMYVELQGFPGIDSVYSLSLPKRNEDHYAVTKSGMYRINSTAASPIYPEISEFLRGKAIQEYVHDIDSTKAGKIKTTYSDDVLDYRLRTMYNDYLLISYSVRRDSTHTHVLVYDIKLDRWGKLTINHVDILDYISLSEFFNVRCNQLPQECNSLKPPIVGNTSANLPLSERECSSFKAFRENNTDNSALFGFLTGVGEFVTAHPVTKQAIDGQQVEYLSDNLIPVMILGDYTSRRDRHTFVDRITVDQLKQDSKVILETFLEKNSEPSYLQYVNIDGGDSADFYQNVTGAIHRLHLVGQANLNTIIVSTTSEGEV